MLIWRRSNGWLARMRPRIAISSAQYSVQGEDIIVKLGTGAVRITLTDLGIEEKGELTLPMQRVDFAFENMSDVEIDDFMTSWDEVKLRIGG